MVKVNLSSKGTPYPQLSTERKYVRTCHFTVTCVSREACMSKLVFSLFLIQWFWLTLILVLEFYKHEENLLLLKIWILLLDEAGILSWDADIHPKCFHVWVNVCHASWYQKAHDSMPFICFTCFCIKINSENRTVDITTWGSVLWLSHHFLSYWSLTTVLPLLEEKEP